jgi:uncharacterized protein with HEPN domain
MGRHDIQQCLEDILASIETIEGYLTRCMGSRRDFNLYRQDKLLRNGIERQLEIIGEATGRILRTDPAFGLTNARKIVDLRNRIIHAYDNVNDTLIWGIVTRHLSPLRAEVERMLG